jgi:uroporphyrinogen decarboxylase
MISTAMTSLERCMSVIDGKIPDRVPTDLHNFLMAARMADIPLSECLQSGELMAQSHLVAWRTFKHDMILVESGTTAVAQALGCKVGYTDEVAPRVTDPVLKSIEDAHKLTVPEPRTTWPLTEVLKAVTILRKELGDSVFIMGRADQAPLALAGAIRGHQDFFFDLGMCEDPAIVHRLLEVTLEATTRYALALKEAGAHGTSLGEFGSDTISPTMYREYALPYLKRFYAAMRAANFPASLHQCGNSEKVLDDMVASGAHILELDPSTDLRAAKNAAAGKTTVLGMVDPANVLHLGDPELVIEKSREALEILAPGGGFILGPGCALMPETPDENVMALIETAHKHGNYREDGTLAN